MPHSKQTRKPVPRYATVLPVMVFAALLPFLGASLWMSLWSFGADLVLSRSAYGQSMILSVLQRKAYVPEVTLLATATGSLVCLLIMSHLDTAPRTAVPSTGKCALAVMYARAAAACAFLEILINCILLCFPEGVPFSGFRDVPPTLRAIYNTDGRLVMVLAAVFTGPVFEELVFRGLTQGRLREHGAGPCAAVAVASVMFGLYHGSLRTDIYAAFMGLVFGFLYERTGRLAVAIAGHAAGNAAVLAIELFPAAFDSRTDILFWIGVGLLVPILALAPFNAQKNARPGIP